MADRPHQLTLLLLGDGPDAWRAAGFDVDASGRFRLGGTEIVCRDSGTAGVVGWTLDGVDRPLDGLAISRSAGAAGGGPDAGGTAPSVHPNGISSIDHVVISTDDCDRTVTEFEEAGLEVRGGRSTSSYGSPMRQTFFWAGDVILELIGPQRPDADGPPRPTSVFGLALVADDLDATAAFLGDRLGSPKDAVQPARRIAGLRHRDVGIGLAVAVMSPHLPTSSD